MNHIQLTQALKALERDLPGLSRRHTDGDFKPAFEAQITSLCAQAEDPDDAVYVMERAETMLDDLEWR